MNQSPERTRKKKYKRSEAISVLQALFSKSRKVGLDAYLISVGNYSKRDYVELGEKINARVISSRSVFSGWLKLISFIVPASWIGALALNSEADCSEVIIDLADHGDILVAFSKNPEMEVCIGKGVEGVKKITDLVKLNEYFPNNTRSVTVNGEDPESVEFEIDFPEAELK